jgi:hypothetical protein
VAFLRGGQNVEVIKVLVAHDIAVIEVVRRIPDFVKQQ